MFTSRRADDRQRSPPLVPFFRFAVITVQAMTQSAPDAILLPRMKSTIAFEIHPPTGSEWTTALARTG